MEDELANYRTTGFSPEQILLMYENLSEIYDLLTRLICGDFVSINKAVDDTLWFLSDFRSYSKKPLH
jgi:hypothetical protein